MSRKNYLFDFTGGFYLKDLRINLPVEWIIMILAIFNVYLSPSQQEVPLYELAIRPAFSGYQSMIERR